MRLIKPYYKVENITGNEQLIELYGRVCYQSEEKLGHGFDFCERRLKDGHESILEHSSMTIRFIIDRGVSHELVRHRLCAFSQESTRYCNYKSGVTFIIPCWLDIQPGEYRIDKHFPLPLLGAADFNKIIWFETMLRLEKDYIALLENGWTPQQARSVLPNSLKTEIVVTANFREWRHILKLRTSTKAHPQMREIMCPLQSELENRFPVIFKL